MNLYNRGSNFNSISNMRYYGGRDPYNRGSYPSFTTFNNVWNLRLSINGSSGTSLVWFWFYDQIGKSPTADVIKPWFWGLKVDGATYDTILNYDAGGHPLVTVEYIGTNESVSEIQSHYNSDNGGGSLRSGNPSYSGQHLCMLIRWYVSNEIPLIPGYSVNLTWRSLTWSNYTWTGQIKIYNDWSYSASNSWTYVDRIDYKPVK